MYALYNERNGRYLSHPRLGRWEVPTKGEATEALARLSTLLEAEGLGDLAGDFSVAEVETNGKPDR